MLFLGYLPSGCRKCAHGAQAMSIAPAKSNQSATFSIADFMPLFKPSFSPSAIDTRRFKRPDVSFEGASNKQKKTQAESAFVVLSEVRLWGIGKVVHSQLEPLNYVHKPVAMCFANIMRHMQIM